MYRVEAKPNKYLWEAQKKHEHELHLKRIRNVKAGVDMKPPKGFGEYRRNVKREQMMEDRYAQIEHENRLLLSKMSDIMQKGSMDNVSNAWQYGHSLNRTNRRKELQRITEENQSILRRIQGVQPFYDHWKWEEEAIKAEKLAESISEYKHRPTGSIRSKSSPSRSTMNNQNSLIMNPQYAGLDMNSFSGSTYNNNMLQNNMMPYPGMMMGIPANNTGAYPMPLITNPNINYQGYPQTTTTNGGIPSYTNIGPVPTFPGQITGPRN